MAAPEQTAVECVCCGAGVADPSQTTCEYCHDAVFDDPESLTQFAAIGEHGVIARGAIFPSYQIVLEEIGTEQTRIYKELDEVLREFADRGAKLAFD